MIFVSETSPNVFVEIAAGAAITVHENGMPDITHPPQVWQAWPREQQEAIGIYQPAPFVAPPGTQAVGEPRIERIDGVVSEVYDTIDLPPVSTPPRMVGAAFNIMIENGDIPAVGGLFNIVGAIYLDVGFYMLMFVEPQPDTNYFAVITGDAPTKRVGEATTEYFMLEARDA